jgi:hypothetical protein
VAAPAVSIGSGKKAKAPVPQGIRAFFACDEKI